MNFSALFTFFLLIYSQSGNAAKSCRLALAETDLTQNITNAKVEVPSYRQPNARTLDSILISLGLEATQHINKLKPGSVVIDSGSGFSIAGAQLAQKKVSVFAINAQNTWEYFSLNFRKNPDDPVIKKILSLAISELGISIKGTGLKTKHNGHGLWVDVDSAKPKDLIIIGERLLLYLKSLYQSGNFNYIVGFSDLALKGTVDFADLIIDNWGAIFYSPNRSLLFDMYFSALKPGGRAYLRIKDSFGNGILDKVIIKSGKARFNKDLIQYLTESFPEIFVVVNNGATLMIKKENSHQSLNLQGILTKKDEGIGELNNGTYPIVTWELN
jgi:hypothetical protein